MRDLLEFLRLGDVLLEVFVALAPLVLFFSVFQVLFLRLPRGSLINMAKGILMTFLGLTLFLQGVKVGFLPVGSRIGETLGAMEHKWLLLPIGFCLGFVATFAEPAVRILGYEVEKASSGAVRARLITLVLSLGVAVFVLIGMARILFGVSLVYFVIPGYLAAIIMLRFSEPTFISIAFDSGGVATGPMTVTFVMALAIGVADALEHRQPIMDGLGLIALVALAPILSLMALGLVYSARKGKGK